MPYLRRLIHRAEVRRPTATKSDTGVVKNTLATVSGMESVPCLLMPADAKRALELFGADLRCDALVYFAAGTDIRPKVAGADGKNDLLVVTDESGAATAWLVEATRDPASARRYLVCAVTRAAV